MPYSEAKLEFIKGSKRGSKDGSIGYPAIQATAARVIKKRFTARKLNELLDRLTPRDQALFFTAMAPYIFAKPAPKKDAVDMLSVDQLNEMKAIIQKNQLG